MIKKLKEHPETLNFLKNIELEKLNKLETYI